MEQKLIILPLNRGISAETLKRQGEGKWEAARTPLRASGGAQPERKPGEEQGRTEAPHCRPRGTPPLAPSRIYRKVDCDEAGAFIHLREGAPLSQLRV